MEITNPSANPADLFYVTTGLLVKELVTGLRQDGDNIFTRLAPSTVQVAGDPNDLGGNSIAPTYASFRQVGTFNGDENRATSAVGSLLTARIDKSGQVTIGGITPPEERKVGSYDTVTGHNIADVFVDFSSQRGPIYDGAGYSDGLIFFGNPTYVLGRPLTEPYWIRVVVGGVEKDVLVQLFERRVLTYTPTNQDPFKVEMGNVGQHYYRWRYLLNSPTSPPSPTPSPTPGPLPQGELQITPNSDYAGQPFQVNGSGFGANETIKLWETDPQTTVTPLLSMNSDAKGTFSFTYKSHGPLSGLWSITAHGVTSGVEKVGYFKLVDYVPGAQPATVELSRTTVTINDTIDVHGYYFLPNELYRYWVTAPDGVVYAGSQPPSNQNVFHDGSLFFRYNLPVAKAGRWAITVTGLFSNRIAVAYFNCNL